MVLIKKLDKKLEPVVRFLNNVKDYSLLHDKLDSDQLSLATLISPMIKDTLAITYNPRKEYFLKDNEWKSVNAGVAKKFISDIFTLMFDRIEAHYKERKNKEGDKEDDKKDNREDNKSNNERITSLRLQNLNNLRSKFSLDAHISGILKNCDFQSHRSFERDVIIPEKIKNSLKQSPIPIKIPIVIDKPYSLRLWNQSFPKDLTTEILKYLDNRSLYRFSQTCSSVYNLSKD